MKIKGSFGRDLLRKRFVDPYIKKKKKDKSSVIEDDNIAYVIEEKKIFESGSEKTIIDKFGFIPPRVKDNEEFIFGKWRLFHGNKIFERNIEIWRQFWIACERADVIIQVLDARDPFFFYIPELEHQNKTSITLINKSDLISEKEKEFLKSKFKEQVIFYSCKENENLIDILNEKISKENPTIALIGYPNVGKSSLINKITKDKRCKESSTPGKTKYIQTFIVDTLTIIDTPGIVFPIHEKNNLILHGIINIDQTRELLNVKDFVIEYLGLENLINFYKLKETTKEEFYDELENKIKKDCGQCIKIIVKDFFHGKIKKSIE
ncbi:GTP-binding protein [Spraguea lophii 42_110]|uniref:GTP-binding protein n=1 Tax=Spraguea lophii (strain 42_110) TaxID=1358809 RepID=S7WEB0_SPRLO|nr:GTP-binding protein [Spraguea lophii 42_110]